MKSITSYPRPQGGASHRRRNNKDLHALEALNDSEGGSLDITYDEDGGKQLAPHRTWLLKALPELSLPLFEALGSPGHSQFGAFAGDKHDPTQRQFQLIGREKKNLWTLDRWTGKPDWLGRGGYICRPEIDPWHAYWCVPAHHDARGEPEAWLAMRLEYASEGAHAYAALKTHLGPQWLPQAEKAISDKRHAANRRLTAALFSALVERKSEFSRRLTQFEAGAPLEPFDDAREVALMRAVPGYGVTGRGRGRPSDEARMMLNEMEKQREAN